MSKRTTIEIDEGLLDRARRALGSSTTKATVEEALRRVADDAEADLAAHKASQTRYFSRLEEWADLTVLSSDEMWR